MPGHHVQSDAPSPPRTPSSMPAAWLLVLVFILGMATSASVLLAGWLTYQRSQSTDKTYVDFSFQMMGLNTTRQNNKTLDIFVKFRYAGDQQHCPFSPTDNTCIQYQLFMRSLILNLTLSATPELPMESEWERVNLAICRGIWAEYPTIISSLSTSLHVNGDGRSNAGLFWEPGAHGTTCTIGPEGTSFAPIAFANRLPSLGPV